MTTFVAPLSTPTTATALVSQLQSFSGTTALSPDVTLEFSRHRVRFRCMDCVFILSEWHLARGVVHLLPENQWDFNEEALGLVRAAIVKIIQGDKKVP